MILAGIDIGTNSLRLLIAETSHGDFREIHSDRIITRLGQGLDSTGKLDPEAKRRTLEALGKFSETVGQHGVQHTSAIGTSALRNASNSRDFIHQIKRKTSLDVRVVTGEEEARLTLLGVAQSLKEKRSKGTNPLNASLVIDIGGGSTEIIISRPDRMLQIESLPLGAVYLTERFIKSDPPSLTDVGLLRSAVSMELESRRCALQPVPSGIFVGTAGTITTLAAIDQGLDTYDHRMINRYVLAREVIDDIVERLSRMSLNDRRTLRGLEPGREDIILAGAVVAQELMVRYGYVSMLVSDWGLREGIVLDLYGKWATSVITRRTATFLKTATRLRNGVQ
jgi:exopolyphosphatase/guanosine-5'-triphosphate,3'-diphosphate pyrophosphatase